MLTKASIAVNVTISSPTTMGSFLSFLILDLAIRSGYRKISRKIMPGTEEEIYQ